MGFFLNVYYDIYIYIYLLLSDFVVHSVVHFSYRKKAVFEGSDLIFPKPLPFMSGVICRWPPMFGEKGSKHSLFLSYSEHE